MPFVIGFIVVAVISLGAGWVFLGEPKDLSFALGRLMAPDAGPPQGSIRDRPAREARKGLAQPDRARDALSAGGNWSSPFDIVKIEPAGTSVFAGRAAPNSVVTVLADGEPVGTAKTDENGEWVLIVERSFATPNPKLTIASGAEGAPTALAHEGASSGRDSRPKTAAAATADMMDRLQRLVDKARSNSLASLQATAPIEREAAASPVPALSSTSANGGVTDAEARPGGQERAFRTVALARHEHRTIPIPIKFVFREANFTKDGRKAAQLLLEYVLLERPGSVTLTGHADERGTPGFNMELSSARLAAVAQFLKAGGYAGQLKLVPMGESEPFTGVDRGHFPPEELFELDRRVELRVNEPNATGPDAPARSAHREPGVSPGGAR
jgi:outer membrane protein OmpA-like peptidoglycan-associated protein